MGQSADPVRLNAGTHLIPNSMKVHEFLGIGSPRVAVTPKDIR